MNELKERIGKLYIPTIVNGDAVLIKLSELTDQGGIDQILSVCAEECRKAEVRGRRIQAEAAYSRMLKGDTVMVIFLEAQVKAWRYEESELQPERKA